MLDLLAIRGYSIVREGAKNTPRRGVCIKWGRTIDFPKKWGECSSNVIIMGGVEIKLVDFGGSVVSFDKNLGEAKKFIEKFQNGGR